MTQKCLGMHKGKSGDAHEEEAMKLEEIHCMEAISSPEGHSVLWCDRRCRKHWIAVARALVSSPWDSSEHGAQREDQAGFHPQGIIHCSQGWHRQCCHSQLARLTPSRSDTLFFIHATQRLHYAAVVTSPFLAASRRRHCQLLVNTSL